MEAVNLYIEERHKEILHIIETVGRISIGDIQQKFGVSLDSARRDLRILEEKGLLKRTHGGAINAMPVRPLSKDWKDRDMRTLTFTDNYLAIAREAANYIKEGDVIFISASSLAFAILQYMPQDFVFTLVITSATLADALKFQENVNVYMTGGKMTHEETAPFEGDFAETFIRNMHFDCCLITGDGFDADFGLSHSHDESAALLRTVLHNSRKTVLMMPKQKIGFKGFIKVCDVNAFDVLITDWDAVPDQLDKIREQGVEVVVADKEDVM